MCSHRLLSSAVTVSMSSHTVQTILRYKLELCNLSHNRILLSSRWSFRYQDSALQLPSCLQCRLVSTRLWAPSHWRASTRRPASAGRKVTAVPWASWGRTWPPGVPGAPTRPSRTSRRWLRVLTPSIDREYKNCLSARAGQIFLYLGRKILR